MTNLQRITFILFCIQQRVFYEDGKLNDWAKKWLNNDDRTIASINISEDIITATLRGILPDNRKRRLRCWAWGSALTATKLITGTERLIVIASSLMEYEYQLRKHVIAEPINYTELFAKAMEVRCD